MDGRVGLDNESAASDISMVGIAWLYVSICSPSGKDARDFLFTLYVCLGGGGGCVIGSSS
jgi:hypothetical protein